MTKWVDGTAYDIDCHDRPTGGPADVGDICQVCVWCRRTDVVDGELASYGVSVLTWSILTSGPPVSHYGGRR